MTRIKGRRRKEIGRNLEDLRSQSHSVETEDVPVRLNKPQIEGPTTRRVGGNLVIVNSRNLEEVQETQEVLGERIKDETRREVWKTSILTTPQDLRTRRPLPGGGEVDTPVPTECPAVHSQSRPSVIQSPYCPFWRVIKVRGCRVRLLV